MKLAEIRLRAARTDALAEFYAGRLGLRLIEQTSDCVRFNVGSSVLTFVKAAEPAQCHFAFNIPASQFEEAKVWLSACCPLVRGEDGEDTFHFADWQADAVYFFDPAGNLVELIARHTLPDRHVGPFDASALLGVSEIGVVSDDVRTTASRACEALGASIYRSQPNDAFVPVGDEEGLLIIVARGRPWFPDRVQVAQPFAVDIALGGAPLAESIQLTSDVTITAAAA
jgi:catechol 2,3-dioxygenase-like lactoylglutathione lyase family enzyme